jgi:DNA transposition AAA+ family ATPase
MTKYKVPAWAKEVRKAMVDLDMSVTDLAKGVGRDRPSVSRVLTGGMMNDTMKEDIISFIERQKRKAS